MKLEEIISAGLIKYNHEGLYNEDYECACVLGELAPCGEFKYNCMAGKKSKCDCGDHDFHVE